VGNEAKDDPSTDISTVNGKGAGYETQNPASYIIIIIIIIIIIKHSLLRRHFQNRHAIPIK
jgi:hypothetical protein